jgi:prophage regulatory protein
MNTATQDKQRIQRQKRTPAFLLPSLALEQRLNLAEVQTLTGKGRTKIYADIKAGRFPEPERDGARCSRWRAGTVIASMNDGSEK